MPKKIIVADQAAPPGGPYSHAVVAGDHAYLSGACPVLPDGTWVTGDFAAGNFVSLTITLGDGDTVEIDVPAVSACGSYEGLDISEAEDGATAPEADACGATGAPEEE